MKKMWCHEKNEKKKKKKKSTERLFELICIQILPQKVFLEQYSQKWQNADNTKKLSPLLA